MIADDWNGEQDMRTVIVYRSYHHGNTKKLIDAIVAAHPEVDLIDVDGLGKKETPDLSGYQLVGYASGIYYGKFDKTVMRVASETMRDGDFIFTICTYGSKDNGFSQDIQNLCKLHQAAYVGGYGCNGYDSYGPFKLVGGLQEKHPTDLEIEAAAAFYDALLDKFGETIAVQRAKRDAQDAYAAAHAKPGVAERVKDAAGKLGGKR